MASSLRSLVLLAAFAWPTAALAAPQVIDYENTTVATGFFSSFQQDGFNHVLTGGAPPTWTTWSGAPLVGTGIRSFSGGGGDAQQGTITRIGGGTFTMSSLIVVNYSNTTALTVRAFNGASQVFTTSIAANASATVNFGNVLATEVRLNGNSANAGGNFGTTFGFDNFTIDVPNVAPTLANIDGNQVNYTQGGAEVVLDGGTAMTVADADSANFNNGSLSLAIFAGGVAAEDVLEVGAIGPITLSGVDVVHSGTTIGSITGSGIGGNPLTITLNANATPARTQDLGRAIRYHNTNNSNPGVNLRRILWSLTDGGGAPPRSYRSAVKVFPLIAGGSVVRVEFSGGTAPNPAFGFPKLFTAGGFTFRTGDGNNATSCDAGCFTSDLDAPNSPGAQILATGLTGLTTTIRRSDNSTFTLVSLVVGNKSSANVTITARNGASVLDTRVLAGGAAQQLSFPNLTVDEVRLTGNTTITGNLVQGWIDDLVVAVANVPAAINNLGGNVATYTQLGTAVTLDTGTAATITDPDSANFDTGSLSASITGNLWSAQDVLGVGTIGSISTSGNNVSDGGILIGTITSNGSSGNPLTITFNANATLARVQNLVRALTYSNSNTNTTTGLQGPDLGNRTVQVLINDGDGAPPGSVSTTVQVRPAPLPGNNQVEVNFNGLSVVGTPNSLAFQNHTFTVTGGSQPYLSSGFLTPSGPSLRAGATEIVSQTFTLRRTDNASFLLASLIVANLSQESARTVRSFNGASTVQTVSLPAGATQRIVFNNSAVTRIEISGSTGLTTAALAEVDDLAIFLPFPNLTINNVTLTEGNSGSTNASFTVSLSGPAPVGGTQFDIATANGTASGGSDFTTTTLTGQTIPEGSSSYTFNVPVLGDNVVEANETFLVNVTNVVRAIVVDGQGQGTINNDDVAGISVVQSGGNTAVAEGGATDTYTVVLTSEPTANVSIALTGTQVSATPTPLVFTAGNWNTPQTVTVTAIDDFVAEGNHAGSVTSAVTSSDPTYNGFAVAAVPVAIADNDNAGITVVQSGGTTVAAEGGASDSYTVVLTSQPTANVSIALTGTQVSALPSPLVFTAGDWNTPKTVTVTAIDDFVAEGNHSGSVTSTVSSGDTNYNAFGIGAISVAITDNDTAGITLVQSGGTTAVTEGGATDSYTLVLTSQPVANVSIALAATQVGAAPAPVVFTAADWNTPKTVTVTATDDFIAEGNHSGSVAHAVTSADGNYNGFAVATVSVSITDNDTPGVTVVQTGGNTAVTEGGATDSYTLVLTSQPTEDVTITPSGTQVGVAPASRTFTAATWNVPQSFTVTAVDDGIVEGTHTGSIAHAVASADPNYGGLAVGGVPGIAITDNDSAIVQFAPASVSQSEGSSPMAFTVTLSNPVQSGVTLAVNSAPGTATAADFTAISAGSVVFPANSTAAQTVNVSIDGDALDEDDEQFTLTLSGLTATGNVSLGTATATATILDDDELPVLSVANVSQDEGDAVNTLSFTVNLNPVSGRAVSFTRATQDGSAVSTPPTPDFVALATAPITIPAGQTSVTIPVTINGDTVYEGDQSFSLNLTAVVNATPGSLAATATLVDDDQQPTTTAITGDAPDPSVVGQGYLVSATVTAQATSPLGSVTISDGSGGSCSAALVPGAPPASSMSCTLASTSAGAKTLSADYSPASTAFAPSSGTADHQVNPAATTISVSGPARSRINQATAFSFALAVSAPGAGTPTGTVTLSSGASSCTATLPATSCKLSFGTLGARTVSASYAGDGNFLASSSSGSGNAQTLVYALSDIAVSKSDGLATYEPGDLIVYSVLVRNFGPDAAAAIRVRDEVPAGLAGVVWSCDASGGALCPVAGGSGNLDVLVATLPSGGVLGFTFYGTVGSAPQIANTAAVELPADTTIEDPLLANNSATDISLLEYLFRNGYEAPAVAAPDGSLVMPGTALRGLLDEVALAVYTLDDRRGIAARVYARVFGGELQYALASRDAGGALRLGAWRSHPSDPSLRWSALPEEDGWRVASVELR